jgi:hypothetical protein
MANLNSLQHISQFFKQKFSHYFPAIFFASGFAWDGITIGRRVVATDLLIFAVYLLAAAVILFLIGRAISVEEDTQNNIETNASRLQKFASSEIPYAILQFLFGSLLSALFFLYFKSASYWLAWGITALLGGLLIANEFLVNQYRRFTLSWALFGFCAMLLFNFALPFLLGSIWPIWFYLSTVLGALLAYGLYLNTPRHLGSIQPVGLIALLLMLAYHFDMIPPVPLVKRDMLVAYDIEKVENAYLVTQQRSPWWNIWQKTSDDLVLNPNQKIFCFTSIFAPQGLKTKLFHRWQIYSPTHGWQTQSNIGFEVNGGRDGGYRGYTFKQNIRAGEWRVLVETENGKTIAAHHFTLKEGHDAPQTIIFKY